MLGGGFPESSVRSTHLAGGPQQLLAAFCCLLLGTGAVPGGAEPTTTAKVKRCFKNGKAGTWQDLGLDDIVEPSCQPRLPSPVLIA